MAMKSWSRAVELPPSETIGHLDNGKDAVIIYRPTDKLPVILWDCEQHKRVVVAMHWGGIAPESLLPSSLYVPSESIESTPGFGEAFRDGLRGAVIVHAFDEDKVLESGETERYTIHVRNRPAVGVAVVWRGVEARDRSQLVLDCRTITVPANAAISPIVDRMPAVLASADWAQWLGEIPATVEELKTCLNPERSDWSVIKTDDRSPPVKSRIAGGPGSKCS